MTNFEKYKDEILKIAIKSNSYPARSDGIVIACEGLACSVCDFNGAGIGKCRENQFKWLYEDDGEEPDGCNGCKYEHKAEDESPCTECCNNYTSKWKRKSKRTRQSEFLGMFPNAKRCKNIIEICPTEVDIDYKACGTYSECGECRKDYWLQEVEE